MRLMTLPLVYPSDSYAETLTSHPYPSTYPQPSA